MYLPGVPCHVIRRGNNREACFFAPQDYALNPHCFGDGCTRYDVAVHAIRTAAWCYMPINDNRFNAQMQKALSLSIGLAKRERPFRGSRRKDRWM